MMPHKNKFKIYVLLIATTFISVACVQSIRIVSADTVDELRNKISNTTKSIQDLEEEIRSYQRQLDEVGKQATSLKNTLAELDLSRKKLETSLKLTEQKISATNQEIANLSENISEKQENIEDDRNIIAQSMNKIYQSGFTSAIETVLAKNSLSETLIASENLTYLSGGIRKQIENLQSVKVELESNKKKTEKKKAELVDLTNELKSQKKIIADTVAGQNRLLAETKNTEANYKKTLADRMAKKEQFEREMLDYESALRIAIDPNSIPHTGTGVLRGPLDSISVTQYFGDTPFATANPQIYNGKGHTGVDFRASIGTPVKASLSGTVVGVANTDIVPTCYSYGKWIMIKHPNGLSTLYAHLSLQNVSVGQEVTTGQVIGYSGNTGYTTGPHLHFGVYATQGVQITKLENSKNCRGVTIPLADIKAYLNPLSFL